MFSLEQKKFIAGEVEKTLLSLHHPEMPESNPKFALRVDGAESWSWAEIKPNWTFNEANKPGINVHNELVAANMRIEQILLLYQQAVNKIDDLLEYRYQSMTPEEIKKTIMSYIDTIAEKLK